MSHRIVDGLRRPAIRVRGAFRDLSGTRNGRLTAVKPVAVESHGHLMWACRCDCGGQITITSNSFRRKGGTRSCGCLRSEVSSRPKKPWNIGKTYAIPVGNGERIFRNRKAWALAVRRVQGDACQECGWAKAQCDVDHIIPRWKGGKNVISNGKVLCPNCHRVKTESE